MGKYQKLQTSGVLDKLGPHNTIRNGPIRKCDLVGVGVAF